MKRDLLHVRKCLHLQLEKQVHSKLRIKMFEHGLSMQDIFGEFARAYVMDDPRAVKIIDELVMRQVRELLGGKEPLKKTKAERISNKVVSELDNDLIYSMIETDKEVPDETV